MYLAKTQTERFVVVCLDFVVAVILTQGLSLQPKDRIYEGKRNTLNHTTEVQSETEITENSIAQIIRFFNK